MWQALQAEATELGHEDQIADLTPSIEQLQTVLASEEPVGSAVRLVGGHWDFTMSNRRIFGVTALQGRVD